MLWMQFLILLILIGMNAFFASSEVALISLKQSSIRKLIQRGGLRGKALAALTGNTGRFLATVQVGVTLAGFLASAFAAESFSDPVAKEAAQRALHYQDLKAGDFIRKTPIQHVFIGSCTNSRLCDLEAAARVLKGRHVAPGVRAQVVPGSMLIRRQAEELGLDKIFKDAGFEWRKSGCSLCLAMNDDILEAGVRCASTTNRNFEGRQGRGSHTHLVSPETAAASAVMGYLCPKSELE